MYKSLELFGFGEKFINMVKVLFTDQVAVVCNNGYWSAPFYPTRGARQGCCYSPGIFTLLVELLGLGIHQNPQMRGVQIKENEEIKAGQFADNLWTTLDASSNNINKMLDELEDFGCFSGLHINPEKCAVLRLGPFKNSDAKYYRL